MSIVTGTLTLICQNCGKEYNLKAEDTDFEEMGSDPDRGMGPESCWSWSTNFGCDVCNNPIAVEYEVWEYPIGAYNNDEVNITGGQELTRFDYDFSESLGEDFRDNDESEEENPEDFMPKRTVTIGELRKALELYPDDYELYFEGLNYERVKQRGETLVQIELSAKPGYEKRWEDFLIGDND